MRTPHDTPEAAEEVDVGTGTLETGGGGNPTGPGIRALVIGAIG
jgi:hypothetical protein